MKENIYNGSLLDSEADIIAHQTNASDGFGSGVAGAIKEKYPRVAEQYHKACKKGLMKLGMCQIVKTNPGGDDNRLVANLCGQEKYGYGNLLSFYYKDSISFSVIVPMFLFLSTLQASFN